ncbi:ATP-dependent DNA helicase [Paenibacillus rhizovicinus]|uniref:ATP-dependent DNA helicase n=1 Tax=Paenibacillus rhizovicinus TaxID=2704463 RepID=A0A6C0P1K3_9BACL|nr:helicase C-terminal domain-containing protein [Paenibacillus rhizovicinus]QHW32420.1 ATP-dependent DNA helicase [Paenibacillus rhizovicinus]
MNHTFQLSVRALVEYAHRSGDIESGFRTATALTEGTKVHQRVQKQYGERDEREVYVSAEVVMDDLRFVVDGRCDGLLADEADGGVIVDEIKSTSGRLPEVAEETYPVHWAQAKCYAYMIASERELDAVTVQLTYVQVQSEEERRFRQRWTREELARFLEEMVRAYYPSAMQQVRHAEARDRSIKELPFPFDAYREGQRKLAGAVYKCIADGQKLFAKAPTGIGKTISTIFPAVKAIGEGLLQRVVYLTAKTSARVSAENAYAMLQGKGLHLQAVTLTAKEKICFQEEVRCSKEHCPFADGYYDRINEALLDLRANETLITREVIEVYARKHRVCPFEFSLDAAYGADAIVCDYNYVFDPRVNLKRMFEEQKRKTAVLVDEAHNLVDRARDMYSAELHKSAFLDVQRAYKGVHAGVSGAAKAVNNYLLAQRKRIGEKQQESVSGLPEELAALAEAFAAEAERALLDASSGDRAGGNAPSAAAAAAADIGYANDEDLFGLVAGGGFAADASAPENGGQGSAISGTRELLELYFACQNFVRTAKLYDERYVTYTECARSEVRIKLFCLDPSHLLRTMGKGYRSTVFFSATLTPLPYYMDMLGSDGEASYSVVIPSPFSREQLDVYISPMSTRYQDRERTKEPIVSLLSRVTSQRKGNYLLFFPSYAYMEDAHERFAILRPEQAGADGAKIIVQSARMSEEERERFLAAFQSDAEEQVIGFAVMGGIFAEGIDLVGDRLTGVAVVGVGLPQVGFERDIMKAYFDGTGRNGFEYAFQFPGMNKVLQAGGRLIRSEQDRGVLLLIDDRYLQASYKRLLPREWLDYTVL